MTIRNRVGFAWMGALAGVLTSTACGKVSGEHGGESHFQCEGDDDCRGVDQVCVRAQPTDEMGECEPANAAPGTGGASSGGAGAGGAPGSGNAPPSTGGSNPGASPGGTNGSGVGPVVLGQCAGACCPTDDSCYATAPGAGSGRECAAFHDNTGQPNIQLRQTSTQAELPLGLTIPIIQQARNGYSRFPRLRPEGPSCSGPSSTDGGRFIQLLEIPVAGSRQATSGFSHFIADGTGASELLEGLCMVDGPFAGEAAYRLAANQMSDSSNYPAGLPGPRGLGDSPWQISPVGYVRSQADFNVATNRESLLARGSGTYFYDAGGGRYHSYAPVAYSVQYNSAAVPAPLVIPIREIETRIVFNDPAHPNCVGGIVPGEVSCPSGPAWDGLTCDGAGNCTPASGAAGIHEGYTLITELEQLFEPSLQTTLCVTMLTVSEAETSGWLSADRKSCKSNRWDPQAPNNEGLPPGDWCAATNSPATATCHDAFRIRERTTFAATKLKPTGVDTPPATCLP